jgi:hypothetical protein
MVSIGVSVERDDSPAGSRPRTASATHGLHGNTTIARMSQPWKDIPISRAHLSENGRRS